MICEIIRKPLVDENQFEYLDLEDFLSREL